MDLTADTRFGGRCGQCKRWCTYTPLPAGRGRAYPPSAPAMNVTCGGCGTRVTLEADAGQNIRQPLVLDRSDLDVSKLRAHVREHHAHADAKGGLPRSNADLAAWHSREHHRYRTSHFHGGPFVLVRRDGERRRPAGQIVKPLGDFTGQDPRERN